MCPESRSGGGCSKRSVGPLRPANSLRAGVLGAARLGHGRIQTTLVYLELAPDPSGSLAAVP